MMQAMAWRSVGFVPVVSTQLLSTLNKPLGHPSRRNRRPLSRGGATVSFTRYQGPEDHGMTTAAEIAYQLGLTEARKGGYTGFCPSCSYETGFSVVDKGGRTLVHCHAGGCTQQELIQALREYGLWGDQAAKSVEFPVRSEERRVGKEC